MALHYSFREGPYGLNNLDDADPQIIGEELSKISLAVKGHLKPKNVVEAASNRRNVLHKFFEWDDKLAAHGYRIDQARILIRAITIQDTTSDNPPRRAFLSIAEDGHSYRSINEVLTSETLQLAVLVAAEKDLRAFESRYAELLDICELVRGARQRLARRISRTKQEEARAQ